MEKFRVLGYFEVFESVMRFFSNLYFVIDDRCFCIPLPDTEASAYKYERFTRYTDIANYRTYLPRDLNILEIQRFFCSILGWTYRLSVVEMSECPRITLTVL